MRELQSKITKFGMDYLKNTSHRGAASKRSLSSSEKMETSNTDPPKKSKVNKNVISIVKDNFL